VNTKLGILLFFVRLIVFVTLLALMYFGYRIAEYALITFISFTIFIINESKFDNKRIQKINKKNNYMEIVINKLKTRGMR